MSTDLTRIGEKARKEPDLVFTTLYPQKRHPMLLNLWLAMTWKVQQNKV